MKVDQFLNYEAHNRLSTISLSISQAAKSLKLSIICLPKLIVSQVSKLSKHLPDSHHQ